MKHKILGQLEFDRIQEAVRAEAVTALGQKLAGRMRPSSDPAKVQQRLDETADGATILRLRGGLPVAAVPDITTALKRAEIGGVLDGSEFAGIVRVLRTVTALDDFFDGFTGKRGVTSCLSDAGTTHVIAGIVA